MRQRWIAFGLLFCMLLVACGSTEPELAEVSGTVTLDGTPLAGANLLFTNQSKAIRGSVGKTDDRGAYRLIFNMYRTGCVPGRHAVDISTQDTDKDGRNIPERVPRRYRGPESELSAEVASGANVFNFDLLTKGSEKMDLTSEAAKAARADSR